MKPEWNKYKFHKRLNNVQRIKKMSKSNKRKKRYQEKEIYPKMRNQMHEKISYNDLSEDSDDFIKSNTKMDTLTK